MLLRLIIIKKLLVAVLLLTVAVLALVGSYRYDQLPQLLQECTDNDHALLAAVVGRGLQDGQTRLLLTALVTGVYGVLIAVAAIATWLKRRWGEWLLLAVLLSSLPMELHEITTEPNSVNLTLTGVTLLGSVVISCNSIGSDESSTANSSHSPQRRFSQVAMAATAISTP